MNTKKIFKLTLERKIIVALSSLVLFLGIAFTYYTYTAQNELLKREFEREAAVLVSILESSYSQPLAEFRLEEVKFMLNYLKDNEDIIYSYIFDENDILLIDGPESSLYPPAKFNPIFTEKAFAAKGLVIQYDKNIMDISTPVFYNNKKVGTISVGFSLDNIDLEVARFRKNNILVSVLFVVIAIVIGLFVSKAVTKPLAQVVNSIKKVSKGDFEQRLEIKADDEIQVLVNTYNEMMDNIREMKNRIVEERDKAQKYLDIARVMIIVLDEQGDVLLINKKGTEVVGSAAENIIGKNWFDTYLQKERVTAAKNSYSKYLAGNLKLNKSYEEVLISKTGNKIISWTYSPIKNGNNKVIGIICSGEDITEKKKAEKELVRAKESAEKSDKLKSEFLAQMSHEIRTPVNTMINFSNLIREDVEKFPNINSIGYFDSIELAGSRLIRTIDSILNMSQLQTGTYEPRFKILNIYDDIINNLENEFKIRAASKKLKFNVYKKTDSVVVTGDEYSITQALINLIDNAVKYTEQGEINVILDRNKKNNLFVAVEDTGIGISEEFLKKIFNPFFQEEQGYTRKFEGNGLGLALVKKYCEVNNAVIDIKSTKNKGTIVTIEFENNEEL